MATIAQAPRHGLAPVGSPRHRVEAPIPVPVPAASTAGGTVGGVGGFFFFGLAALLVLAGLLRARVISTLRSYADSAAPQPFLALLERPG